jgi:hypothetical protein
VGVRRAWTKRLFVVRVAFGRWLRGRREENGERLTGACGRADGRAVIQHIAALLGASGGGAGGPAVEIRVGPHRLVAVEPGAAVLEVGGRGLRLPVPASTAAHLPAAGERVTLFAHLLAREDARTLHRADRPLLLVRPGGLGLTGDGPSLASTRS